MHPIRRERRWCHPLNKFDNMPRHVPLTSVLTCIAILLAVSPCQSQHVPQLWGGLEKGSYPVGFTVLNRRDESRKDSAGLGRPIQISVWYPAIDARSGDSMRFGDYFLLTASQRTLVEPDSAANAGALHGFSAFLIRAGSSPEAAERWLQSRVAARRNATRANRRFPIVLAAQGSFESAYSQAVLAEFLASHGFVVATSPAPLLLEPEAAPRKSLLDLARMQAADLSFVLDEVASAGFGDSTSIAVVAHSFGARSAFLLMTKRHIEGLVSLDGGIANRQGRDWLDSADVDLSKFTSPILHFYQDVDSTVTPDFSLLERVSAADRTIVKVDSIYHIDFTSVGFARAVFPTLAVAPPSPFLKSKTALVAELTLDFLRRVTNGDPQPSKQLLLTALRRSPKLLVVRSMPRGVNGL
jgi:dienelactone hydrolase